jgi:hypothetical protein
MSTTAVTLQRIKLIACANLSLRVNSLPVENVKVRRELVNGSYTGRNELVIHDSVLGDFPLDGAFDIEIKDLTLPEGERKWVPVTATDLFSRLQDSGVIPKL